MRMEVTICAIGTGIINDAEFVSLASASPSPPIARELRSDKPEVAPAMVRDVNAEREQRAPPGHGSVDRAD